MKLRNLLAVSATAFTLLSCNDSDNHPTPGKGELTPITVNIKGNADTRALTGEETGATNENDINSLEFFVFNSDGSFQKYYKPASVASDNQYTFLVNAGSLTILTAANQNLGEPSLFGRFQKEQLIQRAFFGWHKLPFGHQYFPRVCHGGRRDGQCSGRRDKQIKPFHTPFAE